jgi:hypothetical protein
VFVQLLAVVVLDPVVFRDEPAHHFRQLVTFVGPMQAGGNQDQNLFARDPAFLQDAEDGAEHQLVRHWPCHVADQNTRIATSGRHVCQGR